MVELVLISPVLFLLVGGILQMALALNYWLDMQRIANQGARWAVVAQYPLDGRDDVYASGSVHRVGLTDSRTCFGDQAQSDGLKPDGLHLASRRTAAPGRASAIPFACASRPTSRSYPF